MSAGQQVLAPKEDDITKLLMASAHIGTKNIDFQMKKYVYKTRADTGVAIIDLHKTWEKIQLAARVLVAIENPKDITAISGRPYGTRAVLKFANHIGANSIAGRYTPGTFTNQIQKAFVEPRVLVVADPRQDHQPVRESAYVNMPVIAFCNTDTPLRYIDIAIPSNNIGVQAIGVMWWFLAREVLRMRGTILRDHEWDVMPDLYFYRDPEEVEKEEMERAEKALAIADEPAALGQEWMGQVEQVVAPVEGFVAVAPTDPNAGFVAPTTTTGQEQWGGAQPQDAGNWDASAAQEWKQ